MNNLIVKIDNQYFKYRDFLWDNEINSVFSIGKKNYMKNANINDNLYVVIKKKMYSINKLILWNNETTYNDNIKFIEDESRRCSICTLYRNLTFYKGSSKICSICLTKNNVYKNKKFILRETDEDYREADDFLRKMKAKKWLANEFDIFKLIDIYERYYPQATIAEGLDEDKAIKILEKIIKKHIRKANDFS
jgi:hypothetical protein